MDTIQAEGAQRAAVEAVGGEIGVRSPALEAARYDGAGDGRARRRGLVMELQPAAFAHGFGEEAGQLGGRLLYRRRGRLGEAGADRLHMAGDEARQPPLLPGRQPRNQRLQLGRGMGWWKLELAGEFLMDAGRVDQPQALGRATGGRGGRGRGQMFGDGEAAPGERLQRGPSRLCREEKVGGREELVEAVAPGAAALQSGQMVRAGKGNQDATLDEDRREWRKQMDEGLRQRFSGHLFEEGEGGCRRHALAGSVLRVEKVGAGRAQILKHGNLLQRPEVCVGVGLQDLDLPAAKLPGRRGWHMPRGGSDLEWMLPVCAGRRFDESKPEERLPEFPLPLRRVAGAQVADGQRCAGGPGSNIIQAVAAHGGVMRGDPDIGQELLLSERRLLEPVEREWRRLFVVRIQQRCADGQAAQEAATIGIGDGAAPECGPAPESRVAEECKGVMNGAEGRYHGAILGGQEERTSRAMCEIFRMAAQGVRYGRIGAYGSVGTSYPDG